MVRRMIPTRRCTESFIRNVLRYNWNEVLYCWKIPNLPSVLYRIIRKVLVVWSDEKWLFSADFGIGRMESYFYVWQSFFLFFFCEKVVSMCEVTKDRFDWRISSPVALFILFRVSMLCEGAILVGNRVLCTRTWAHDERYRNTKKVTASKQTKRKSNDTEDPHGPSRTTTSLSRGNIHWK